MAPEQRIRKDFKETPSAVLKCFADMGYSRRRTAEALDMDRGTLRRLIQKYDIQWPTYKDMNESCKAPGRKALNILNRPDLWLIDMECKILKRLLALRQINLSQKFRLYVAVGN